MLPMHAIAGNVAALAGDPASGGGGGSYIGAGDIATGAAVWCGLRGYSAAYATGSNPAIKIRRASDDTTLDINILSNGNLDIATATTFCAATTCFVAELYDQSGNGLHATQSTAANQPQLALTGAPNGGPALIFAGSQWLATGGTYTHNAKNSLSVVFDSTSTSDGAFAAAIGINYQILRVNANGATGALIYNGAEYDLTISNSAFHALNFATDASGNLAHNLDGTTGSGTYGTSTDSVNLVLGAFFTDGTLAVIGSLLEFGVWDNVQNSAGVMTSLNSNQHTYWSF